MSLKEYISRKAIHLTTSIEVHTLDESFMTEKPEVHTFRKSVEVHALKPELKTRTRTADLKARLTCKIQGVNFSKKVPEIKGFRVKRYTMQDINIHGMPKRRKISIWKGTKKAQGMAIELENKLKTARNKPVVSKNEVVLAWYWPIVDGAVLKLALNKQRGTLLVWYDPRSRKYKARGVYLIRRLGLGEKPEWRWV